MEQSSRRPHTEASSATKTMASLASLAMDPDKLLESSAPELSTS